jgi:uncharacterized protein YecA (UPF0149 family)
MNIQSLKPPYGTGMPGMDVRVRLKPPRPIQNTALRIGRNDPCPCGCGRKYKQHLLLEQRG